MNGLHLCTIRLRCHACNEDMKVHLQQIADEELIFCKCGKGNQLFDFGRAVKQILEEEEEMREAEV